MIFHLVQESWHKQGKYINHCLDFGFSCFDSFLVNSKKPFQNKQSLHLKKKIGSRTSELQNKWQYVCAEYS